MRIAPPATPLADNADRARVGRARTTRAVTGRAPIGLALAACSSTATTSSGQSTTTAAAGANASSTTAGGPAGGSGGADGCEVLTAAEFASATQIQVTVTAERRAQDLNCAYATTAGSTVGELVITQRVNAETVIKSTSATKQLPGIGDGAALATDLQGYLVIGQRGYVWTTLDTKSVSGAQVESLLEAVAA